MVILEGNCGMMEIPRLNKKLMLLHSHTKKQLNLLPCHDDDDKSTMKLKITSPVKSNKSCTGYTKLDSFWSDSKLETEAASLFVVNITCCN